MVPLAEDNGASTSTGLNDLISTRGRGYTKKCSAVFLFGLYEQIRDLERMEDDYS